MGAVLTVNRHLSAWVGFVSPKNDCERRKSYSCRFSLSQDRGFICRSAFSAEFLSDLRDQKLLDAEIAEELPQRTQKAYV